VVAILGILATLAVPRLFPQTERARAAEAISMLGAIRQGEEAYFLENGQYIESTDAGFTWDLMGMEDPNVTSVYFTYAIAHIGGDNQTFRATATRTAVDDGTGAEDDTINLDDTGAFCGDHAFVPGGTACV